MPGGGPSSGEGTPVTNPGTTFDTYVSDTGKLASRMEQANATIQQMPSQGITDFRTPLDQVARSVVSLPQPGRSGPVRGRCPGSAC